MNESTSNKDVKNANIPSGGGGMPEETKRNEQQSTNPKNVHSQASEKLKRGISGFQNYSQEIKEDEKVPDTEEKKENVLHGPDASILLENILH